MRILVLNPGSSSLKASVLDTGGVRAIAHTEVSLGADATEAPARRRSVATVLQALEREVPLSSVQGVGHRVVHGGTRFRSPVWVDDSVVQAIDALREYAPLHNAIAAETIRAARSALPDVPQVACFDTAFHATLPEPAFVYPLPYAWYRDGGIRRFGFHGLSVAWALERASALLAREPAQLALLVAHLGSGCSVTAVLGGRSADTSMGMTPMEGLMMGTRSGSVDPGIMLYLLRTGRSSGQDLEEQLDHHAGLVGISGLSAGMREIEQAASTGEQRAQLAIDVFVRRAAAGIAAAATTLPRLDALVFTGGIGEHSGVVRSAIVARLRSLGVAPIDVGAVQEDAILSRPGAAIAVLRIESREDAIIARQTAELLTGG